MIELLCNKFPLSSLIRGLLERSFSGAKLDALFERESRTQYTKTLLFSTICEHLLKVVLRAEPSVHAAYQASEDEMSVSKAAFYDKLKNIEPHVSAAVVRENAQELMELQDAMGFKSDPLLAGYTTRILDGNCIEASEKRLKVLRNQSSAPLPGKSLVIYDPERDLVLDVIPCEDGHAQERSLFDQVIPLINHLELWITDRNFCTIGLLKGTHQQGGLTLTRQHGGLPFKELSAFGEISLDSDGQEVQEQDVEIDERVYRRIRVKLKQATRDGDTELFLITDLPKDISAAVLSDLYRKRWKIETAFQKLEAHLESEINTLAYPRAALFGFCMALLAYNAFSMVLCALDCVHEKPVSNEISTYYIAHEISSTFLVLFVLTAVTDWQEIAQYSTKQFAQWLLDTAKNMKLSKYKKHVRGPKKAKEKIPPDPKKPHVSTAKLLLAAKAAGKSKKSP